MIPISDIFCLTCGRRYPRPSNPLYCWNTIMLPGALLDRPCPGPLLQVFIVEPALPSLDEALAEAVA